MVPARSDIFLARWLLLCAALVATMVVVGGITRLTGSGLSMVEWQPVYGVLPPLGQADWERLFALYQATPQYKSVNAGMTVVEFRYIFWWEYFHRLLGRAVGLVFALPYAWFLLRGRLSARQAGHYFGLLLLGGAQGALGWYMVASGLIDRPWVSPLRLGAHLLLAALILTLLLWEAMRLLWPTPDTLPDRRLAAVRRLVWVAFGAVALTMLSGAFMAGAHAGFVFNSWPLMDGRWLPRDYFAPAPQVAAPQVAAPWIAAPFEHVATINFNHRWLAIMTLILVLAAIAQSRYLALTPRARRVALAAALFALAQVGLGLLTLLLVVPLPLASLHQATALLLFSSLLWLGFELRAPRVD